MKYCLVYLLIATVLLSCEKEDDAAQPPVIITSSVLTSNLNFPWEILWGPDSTIWIKQLKLNGTSMTEISDNFVNLYGRMRDLAISPTGKVYICTDNGSNTDVIVEVKRQ